MIRENERITVLPACRIRCTRPWQTFVAKDSRTFSFVFLFLRNTRSIIRRRVRGGGEKPSYLTSVAGSGASVPTTPSGPLAERFGWRCLVFRRTRWKVYADIVVVVVSHADSPPESRGWIRARASSRFHRESTGLRARRPGRPSCPLPVNRAIGHSNSRPDARRSTVLRRRIVAIPRLALADIRGLIEEKREYESNPRGNRDLLTGGSLDSPLRHARNECASESASASVPRCRVDTRTTSSRRSNHRPRDP